MLAFVVKAVTSCPCSMRLAAMTPPRAPQPTTRMRERLVAA
jgi:hypothetical protein